MMTTKHTSFLYETSRRTSFSARIAECTSTMSNFSDNFSDLSVVTTNETLTESQGIKRFAVWDEKAAADPRCPNFFLVPRPPTPTRSTFASICIVATCTSAQLMSTGLGSAYSILAPSAGKDLHIKKEDLQWILNAYSISSVNKFNHVQQYRYGRAHFGPAYRHVFFFLVGDWQTYMVASECGLLDTRF